MKVKSYKELNVWQKGIEIADNIYRITESFPQTELYGLTSQMRRSAISIPSNIAEGFVRGHTAEYKQFLRVALGSCAELDTQLIIAHRRNYTTQAKVLNLQENLDHECRMIMNLIKSLSKNVKP
ncbi:MAG: four helix bundle protein [Planctomycetota bacterium]|jgi:four helix bundle protein